MVEERGTNNNSTLKPNTTERVFQNKPVKTKSATSFHLPAAHFNKETEAINN